MTKNEHSGRNDSGVRKTKTLLSISNGDVVPRLGRKRFVFKNFSQRLEEIEIDVYRSLDPLKAEPSEGSSFIRDYLVQWRELNTTEDFISFYEEMMPLVQTLPQVLLHKELIISKILARLEMRARLSLEPMLRLIGALSWWKSTLWGIMSKDSTFRYD